MIQIKTVKSPLNATKDRVKEKMSETKARVAELPSRLSGGDSTLRFEGAGAVTFVVQCNGINLKCDLKRSVVNRPNATLASALIVPFMKAYNRNGGFRPKIDAQDVKAIVVDEKAQDPDAPLAKLARDGVIEVTLLLNGEDDRVGGDAGEPIPRRFSFSKSLRRQSSSKNSVGKTVTKGTFHIRCGPVVAMKTTLPSSWLVKVPSRGSPPPPPTLAPSCPPCHPTRRPTRAAFLSATPTPGAAARDGAGRALSRGGEQG